MDNNGFNFFENSGYNNQRNKIKTLILDVRDGNDLTIDGNADQTRSNLNDKSEFQIKLLEPMIIDKPSEIYLDHLITYNCILSHTAATTAFCLRINEFNIQTNVASYDDNEKNTIFNSIVIPNENNVPENYYGAVSHKGKKFNYVCDINPTTLHSLSGKITNLDGSSAFHGGPDGTVFTYALTGISNLWAGAGHATALSEGEQIVNIYINNQGDNFLTGVAAIPATNPPADAVDAADYGTVLAGQITNSPTIIFTAKADLIARGLNPATGDTVYMKIDGREYQFSGNLHVLKQNARFIAEFSIVAKN